MSKMTIIEQNKKILIASGVIVFIFTILVIFAYLPMRKKTIELRTSLERSESEVKDINKLLGEGKRIQDVIDSLKSKLAEIDKKFPGKEEVIFRELSDYTLRMGIETGPMRPKMKSVITEIDGIQVGSDEYVIQEMPISISLKAGYKKLGEFFRVLDEEFPVFIKIVSVNMRKAGDASPGTLEAALELNTYLVSTKAK